MYIWLTRAQAKYIADHARQAAPEEACGLIGSRDGIVIDISPIQNVAANPETSYRMDSAQQVKVMTRYQKQNITLAAIFHSHPATDPAPSTTDVRDAAYPGVAHIIISLAHNQIRFAAWMIDQGSAYPNDLIIADTPPAAPERSALTRVQKMAAVISTVVAILILVAYSVYLLPPAPPIPTPGG